MEKADVSIIIPAYNEERRIHKTLEKTLEYLKNQSWKSEIIVVDNGSTDNTIAVAKKFKNVKLLSENTRGKGAAVRKGMLNSSGKFRLFSDADLSTPITELDKFMRDSKHFSVLIGSREIPGAKLEVPQSFARRFIGRGFSFLVELILGLGITDTQCGFKMFSEEAAKKIFNTQKLNGWGFDVELLYLAQKYGFGIKEIPVKWINDKNTKVRWHAPFYMLLDVLQIRFNRLRGRYR